MANRDLTKGEPGRILRAYCLPMFGSVFFQQMYNLADSFTAGRFIGEAALAAVGNSYELTLIYLAFALGCNTGASVVVARYFGAKRYDRVKTAIFTALIATGVVCAALLLAGMALAAPLLRAIRTPSNTFRDSITYLKIYTAALPFVFFYNVTNGIFSALGDSQTPFLFLVVSSCANVALDILFVARLGMKVSGVGWATFLCQGAACIPAAIVLVKKIKKLEAGAAPAFERPVLRKFVRVAVPGVLQQGVVAAGNIAIQGVVNVYGAAVMAGYSAAVKMNNLVTACFSTIGSGVSNFTAQNLGAARPERLRGGFRASVWLVWTIALTMCLIYELIPGRLVRVFLTDASDKALKTGVDFRRIAAPFYFAPAVKIMCDGVLCGADKMKHVVFTIFLDLSLRALTAAVCSAVFGTAFSVWFAWPIGWVIAAVVTGILFRQVLWRHVAQVSNEGLNERFEGNGG